MENDKLLPFLLVKSVYLGHHLLLLVPKSLVESFSGAGAGRTHNKKLKFLCFSLVLLRSVGPAVFSSLFLPLQKEPQMIEYIVLTPANNYYYALQLFYAL